MHTIVTLNKPYDIPVTIPTNIDSQSRQFAIDLKHISTNTKLSVKGFVLQADQGMVRYSLPIQGEWQFEITAKWSELPIEEGTLTCESSSDTRYPTEVTPSKVRPIFTKNTRPYFISMYECNWLFALWMSDEKKAKEFLLKLKKYRFNAIAMNVYAHECFWTDPKTPGRLVPPPVFNWGGSNDEPDFSVTNPAFYEQFDGLLNFMYELDITAHLYLFVWNKCNAYPKAGSAEETKYISYLVRRYQAYPNIVWDYCKEAYLRIDKGHIRKMLELIRKEDSYKRLLTVHDDKLIQYDRSFDTLLDFYTMQVHHDIYTKTLREIEKNNKPVFTSEYTYESGKDIEDKTFQEAHSHKQNILASWELAIAGSPVCYYYTFTAWDVIRPDDTPLGYAGFAFLSQFFDSFDWWNYTAVPENNTMIRTIIACAQHINEPKFLLITDKRGRFGVLVDSKEYIVEGEWIDIYNGERRAIQSTDLNHIYDSEILIAVCPFAEKYGDMGHCVANFTLKKL
ncbi:DUF4038 domain-containing protein [uncultured Sphaerochaeta sp.]|uniref:apiosidase-like domain-containing protein n=1 Tax=uncultured Sphaerochaeta sp. TaxID=886478 RepID=UPI002A0A39D8|nr:DUF4038 domain-containing protein [uncultured Sphaerochaeta sp.]